MKLAEAAAAFTETPEDLAEMVRDLINALADTIEDREPYATRTIDHLRRAANRMDELPQFLKKEGEAV